MHVWDEAKNEIPLQCERNGEWGVENGELLNM